MDRFLDIVNEDDNIIGSKTRAEIHKEGLLHREVHVWMFDEKKNIFFQKRALDRSGAGLLDATVGGHVDSGEKYMSAAIREAKEETSITISPDDLVLLGKIKVSNLVRESPLETVNNFIRTVYVYKKPVQIEMLKKEASIHGGGFQKISFEFLSNPSPEHTAMFDKFILSDEIPLLLEYLK